MGRDEQDKRSLASVPRVALHKKSCSCAASTMAEEFDVLITSTSLAESILAAALAKAGKRVLHLDAADAYGSQDIALSLEGFHEWAQAKTDADVPAEIPPALSAAKRKFNLALRPTLVPALSPFVDTLIASGAANYSGFRLLEAMALLRPSPDESSQAQPELKSIPASKEEIFNSKELSLVEKRRVMKFLQFAIGDLEQAESLKEYKAIGNLLRDKFSLKGDLFDSVLYGVCFSDSDQEDSKTVLLRLQKYLRSGGRYGTSPFLIGQYGGSAEILQGFCRICAVFGGTYMLGSSIPELPSERNVDEAFDIPQLGQVKTTHVVKQSARSLNTTARAVLILNQPIAVTSAHKVAVRNADVEMGDTSESKLVEKQAETALIVLPPRQGRPCVRAIMHGEGTFTAPEGFYVVYLSCPNASKAPAKDVLQTAIDELLHLVESDAAALLYCATFNDQAPDGLVLDDGSDDVEANVSLAEVSDVALQQAQRVFTSITGRKTLFEPEASQQDGE